MITPNTLLQDRYLVQKQIGQGGMGTVYVATDQRFGSTVALKVTRFDDSFLRKAFEREAHLLNHLRHPALPRVSDHFTEETTQFIVMEYIPGADLSEMLKERGGPFPLATVLDWADQLLEALDYLHTQEPSVVHRDIKPQNLKLTTRDRVVLLDFGLAKGNSLQASSPTRTGSLFGYSFNYAPLEQMQGTGTDPRSDLYSLGATLYHLLTNVTPPDALTRATAIVNGEPDPLHPATEVHPQITASVARVLASAMAQSAAKRPQSAAVMRAALREAKEHGDAANVLTGAPSIFESRVPEFHKRETEAGTKASGVAAGARIRKAATGTDSHHAPTIIQSTTLVRNSPSLGKSQIDGESQFTKFKPYQPPAPKPHLSDRTKAVLIGIILFSMVAAVYAFTRKSSAQTPSAQTIAPLDGTSATTPGTPLDTQTATPSASYTPASSQPASNSSGYPPQSQPAGGDANPPPATVDNNGAPATQPGPAAGTSASNPSGPTPEEERAAKAEEARRLLREQDAAAMRRQRDEAEREKAFERERALERERAQQRQRQPPPPPPPGHGFPPPPRKGGPPPF